MARRENITEDMKAAILVDCLSMASADVGRKYGLKPATVRGLKSRCRGVWNGAQSNEVSLPVLLRQKRDTSALTDSAHFKAYSSGDYTEDQFKRCVFDASDAIARHHRWPRIVAKSLEFRLPNRKKIDLLFHHEDDTYTIAEVKSCCGDAVKATGWLLYGVIGQLLYYGETLADAMDVPWSRIRLCVVADYNPDVYFVRSLAHVDPVIHFVNGSLFAG